MNINCGPLFDSFWVEKGGNSGAQSRPLSPSGLTVSRGRKRSIKEFCRNCYAYLRFGMQQLREKFPGVGRE
jgi:hypothetical protein